MIGLPPRIAIGGPTATGKTVLAVELALRGGGELVNADSRQLVRRLHAGTATPAPAELRGVRCHLLEQTDPGVAMPAAEWARRARAVLADLEARGVPAIVVGGTGQYIRALRRGWSFGGAPPDPGERVRLDQLAATAAGRSLLVAELRRRDPDGAAGIDLANPRRVIRALEILRGGAPSLAAAVTAGAAAGMPLVVLDADRGLQAHAIDARIEAMFGAGAILEEVRAELCRGTTADALRRAGIGYSEAVDVIAGALDVGAARESTRRRTARYAKAQRTWFRQEDAALRLERSERSTITGLADEVLAGLAADGDQRGSASSRKFSRNP